MAARLYDLVVEHRCRTVTIIGLAKNTGKTVTFNQLAAEAHGAGARLLLASFGRDGEFRDILLRHRKPGIAVPAGALYATTDRCAGPDSDRAILGSLGYRTPLGEVNLYRAGPRDVDVQLCGLHRTSRLAALARDPRAVRDLFLIDGAVNRRAMAVPDISDGVIVATGAALGGLKVGAEKIRDAVATLVLPSAADTAAGPLESLLPRIHTPGTAWISRGGEGSSLPGTSWLSGGIPEIVADLRAGDLLYLDGALTDGLASRLLALPRETEFSLVLSDSTRVFVSPATLSRLASRGIPVFVRDRITLLAVTVNPFNPWGPDLNPAELEATTREALPGVPVFNVRSPEYAAGG